MSNKNLKWSDPHSKPVEDVHAFAQRAYESYAGYSYLAEPWRGETAQEELLRRVNENLRAKGLGR